MPTVRTPGGWSSFRPVRMIGMPPVSMCGVAMQRT
ncbi:hypothetical protein SUDANB15_03481 [Streptomyces sp. enrichment culture]